MKTMSAAAKVDTKPSRIHGVAGTEDTALNFYLLVQALSASPQAVTSEATTTNVSAAVAMVKGINPKGELEGMLAVQMVTAHNAIMECHRRAMVPNQTIESRDMNLKHAAKLSSIFATQLDALNKHRGKGQRNVTVKHVHVEVGANAVARDVHNNPGRFGTSTRSSSRKIPRITNQASAPVLAETETRHGLGNRPR